MGYFRISNAVTVASGSTSIVGEMSGSLAPRAWGFLVPTGATGTIYFKDGGAIPAESFVAGVPVPASLQRVTTTAGTIYVLQ